MIKANSGEITALHSLLETLSPKATNGNRFQGPKATEGWQRVFGGLVLGQAVSSVSMTVDANRPIHSLHGYFLLGGDPTQTIDYEVNRIRDGASFNTRLVHAMQQDRAIFSMSASFHKQEPGLEHQDPMPDVPPPEDLPTMKQLIAPVLDKMPPTLKAYWSKPHPIEGRLVDASRYASRKARKAHQAIWIKTAGPMPDTPYLHKAVAAYTSDFTLLDTALIAHGKLLYDPDMQLASLDHAMWFHRDFRIDDWLLYVQESPTAAGARGFSRGTLFDRKGRLVASTVQEGLMRPRTTPPAKASA